MQENSLIKNDFPENGPVDDDLLVYLSIPFVIDDAPDWPQAQCKGDRLARMAYLDALQVETESAAGDFGDRRVRAVRIGGPSPSIMDPDRIGKLLLAVRRTYTVDPRAEVSIKATPLTVGTPSLTGWAYGNPTRIDLQVDSLKTTELEAIGRPWARNDVQNAILFLDKFHVNNVGLSLLYDLPGQTEISWKQTLRDALDLEPTHVSIRPYRIAGAQAAYDPERRERQGAYYDMACAHLAEGGFDRYAVGAFARTNHRDVYRSLMAEGLGVVGLGLGAWSHFDGYAYANTQDFDAYLASKGDPSGLIVDPCALTAEAEAALALRSRLYLREGVDIADLAAKHGDEAAASAKQVLDAWKQEGLVQEQAGRMALTVAGEHAWTRGPLPLP